MTGTVPASRGRRRRAGAWLRGWHWPRPGLLARVAIALAIVGLAPLAIMPYLIRSNRQAMTEQVLRLHATAARGTSARVGAFVDALRRPALALAHNPAVLDDPRSAAARQLLAGALLAQPLLALLELRDPEGRQLIRVQDRGRAAAAGAVLDRAGTSSLATFEERGQLWLRGRLALPDGRGELWLVADAEGLRELVRPEELGEEAALALGGPAGAIVASEPFLTLDAFPDKLVEAARSAAVFGAGRYRGAGAEDVLAAYAPVASTPWFVVSRQPARVAEQVAERLKRRSLIAVAAALALTALLSAAAYRSLIRPLRELVRAQRRLARGGAAPVGSGNEIEQLRESFSLLLREAGDRDALGNVFLGRYQVLETLGAGGMGTVFRGWDPKLQRYVALKTLRLGPASEGQTHRELVEGLVQEAITGAQVAHPNVVAVYDVEDVAETAFIAMEFVDGISLAAHVSGGRRVAPQAGVPLVAAIARGLGAAHARGVVHRDVKPGNVLLGWDGSIKVTDFGIARLLSSLAGDADTVFGTPGYMPPEAVAGNPGQPGGDLFALGVILWEVLAGRRLFKGKGPLEIARSTLEDLSPPLRSVAAGVPAEVEALVVRLLDKDPVLRLSSADEVAEQLEELARLHGWKWAAPDRSTIDEGKHDHRHAGYLHTFSVSFGSPAGRTAQPGP